MLHYWVFDTTKLDVGRSQSKLQLTVMTERVGQCFLSLKDAGWLSRLPSQEDNQDLSTEAELFPLVVSPALPLRLLFVLKNLVSIKRADNLSNPTFSK